MYKVNALTESVISHGNFPIQRSPCVENVKPAHFGNHYFFTEVGFQIQFDFFFLARDMLY